MNRPSEVTLALRWSVADELCISMFAPVRQPDGNPTTRLVPHGQKLREASKTEQPCAPMRPATAQSAVTTCRPRRGLCGVVVFHLSDVITSDYLRLGGPQCSHVRTGPGRLTAPTVIATVAPTEGASAGSKDLLMPIGQATRRRQCNAVLGSIPHRVVGRSAERPDNPDGRSYCSVRPRRQRPMHRQMARQSITGAQVRSDHQLGAEEARRSANPLYGSGQSVARYRSPVWP
jgi:hypothetical protein